ncbi:glycosyltransferase [Macrococcus brunensis]|uniref:Putative glycosyltransferase TagX n=1 Tax=Macrococcus brunensis TaxID=198483 RepID=A0A4R6BAN3_9STAP|nr:glycosyltransferase [Macrococcus brunensis]TDL93365.1 glycosyltransferase [Macrococcus brunensis]
MYRKRLSEIEALLHTLDHQQPATEEETFDARQLPDGITIIIPMYKGKTYIEQLLKTLTEAAGTYTDYEVIFILNGETENVQQDRMVLEAAGMTFPYKILMSEVGAAAARNVGIHEAAYSHCLFLDADDTLSPRLLEQIAPYLSHSALTVFELHDITDGKIDSHNVIQQEIKQYMNQRVSQYDKLTKVLSMNGAKIIPTLYLKNTKYQPQLRSGEDVVLMMSIITEYTPDIQVVPAHTAIYYRHMTTDSLSRTTMSYDFNVEQRFDVIQALGRLLDRTDDLDSRQLIINRMDAQAGFVNRYLSENPDDYQQVIALFEILEQEYIPFQAINKGLARTLYIGYCFPPYSDTSGIVLAKRIYERGRACDVISNNMSDVRETDYTLKSLAQPFIDRHFELDNCSSFSSWPLIEAFIIKGLRRVKQTHYHEIYSRVLWPGSHFLAFKIKHEEPQSRWIAEFSDPVLHDIKNDKRESKIYSRQWSRLFKQLDACWQPYIDHNLFNMTEIIAFAAADELVFTNTHQLEMMIERFPEDIKAYIRAKSVIAPHPVMPERFYHKGDAIIPLESGYYHIGYFGNFYATRGLDEIVTLLTQEDILRTSLPLKMHIFTSNPKQVKVELIKAGVGDRVIVYPYLGYFDFLNMTTQLDALVVMDAHTKAYKRLNPYLPSKLSDYLGSGRPIIAFTEEGSIMDSMTISNILKIQLKNEVNLKTQ